MNSLKNFSPVILCLLVFHSFGQQKVDLVAKFQNNEIKAVNRTISVAENKPDAVEMNAQDSDGLGVLEEIKFEKGSIEVEILGENNPGKSFVGIAFNIQNDDTYEAIYFRPFNFVAEEQIRKEHMVQYIFHPEFTWRKLREERTGEFENEISTPPNPDHWFKVRINIDDDDVAVYLDGISEPILVVERLTSTKSTKIGVWTGFGSSGRFRNMVLSVD